MSRSFRDLLFSPARGLGLLAIRLYQRHVSPHKGYACAWRCHTGGAARRWVTAQCGATACSAGSS